MNREVIYSLKIAGYIIRLESDSNCGLTLSDRFLRNITDSPDPDIEIVIHSGSFTLPGKPERVFHAPLFEEVNGVPLKRSDTFWSIWKSGADLYIKTIFPFSGSSDEGILRFSLTSRSWEMWTGRDSTITDPLDYPLDSLILYYLTVMNNDIFVHASGINHSGNGYIFSGVSGKGKTTMANLWKRSGADVIHDDRLIIRQRADGYWFYNTPVYQDESPSESRLQRIFLIEHGKDNNLTPVTGAAAISQFMSNCIQHNWNNDLIARLIGAVSLLCSQVPVFRLSFRPDRSVIDFIMEHE